MAASAAELAILISVRDMASKQLSSFGKELGGMGTAGKVAAVGLAGLATAGLGLIAGIGSAVGTAMDFESAMSAVAAVAGGTDADLKRLSDTALQLGQDTTLSGVGATDAARAMRELAAAGLSVDDIVGGAALGALRLASAGGIDVARASEIAAMALANFGLSGSEAANVADLFAGAANSSAISVDDIAEAMKYVGPIANSMGLSIEEVTATIAALGNQGIKGSQAGTSLRSMLVNLAKPSKQAAKVIKDLGLEFFDANGEMRDLAGISEELKTGMSGLTDQQRAAALATLFGNEALTAATVLYGEGAEGINKWLKEITEGATAAEVGAKRNDNLKGSIEALTGSAETALIAFGMGLTPALKDLALGFAGAVSAAIPFLTAIGQRLGQALTVAVDAVRVFGSAFAELIKGFVSGNFNNAFGPIMAAIGMLFGPETMAKVTLFVSNTLTALQNFRNGVVSGFGAVLDAIASLVSGQTTLGEFAAGMGIFVSTVAGNLDRLVTEAAPHVARFFEAIGKFIAEAIPVIATAAAGLAGALGGWITTTAIPFLQTNLPAWGAALWGWITNTAVPAVAGAAASLAGALGGWITTTAIPFLTTQLPAWGAALWDWITNTAVPTVVGRVVGLANAMSDWVTTAAIPFLTEKLPAWGAALWDWITNTAVPTVVGRVVGLANALADWVTTQAVPLLNEKLPQWGNAIGDFITGTAVPTTQGQVIGLANALSGWIPNQAVPRVQEYMPLVVDAVVAGIDGGNAETGTAANQWGYDIGVALADGMLDAGGAAIRAALDNWQLIMSAQLSTIPALVIVQGAIIAQAFADGLLSKLGQISLFGAKLALAFLSLTNPMQTVMFNIANGMIDTFLAALESKWGTVTGWLSEIPGRVKAAVGDLSSALYDAGVQAVMGLARGIIDSIPNAVGAAGQLASQVAGALAGALKIRSPSKVTMEMGREIINGLVKGMDEKQQDAAKKAADVASAIAKAVTDVLSAVRALSGFNFAADAPTGEQLGWFRHLTESLVATMIEAAQGFEEEGLKAAERFAEAAGKVGGAVKGAVDGLLALGQADWATSSPTGSAMGWFTHLISSLISNFAAASAMFAEGALEAAASFADAAGKVGGSVKNAVDGLTALASADWANSSPSGSAMAWFTHLIASLVQNFATAAQQFAEGALESAGKFAEAAGKVAGVIGPAIEGFAKMATLSAPSESAVNQLAAGIRAIVRKFAQMASELSSEGIKATGDFADAAGKALGAAKTGVELFAAMAGDKDKAGNREALMPPSAAAIDALMHAIRYVVNRFAEMARSMEEEGVKQMQAFASAAGQVLASAKAGTDLFKQMEKLAVPSEAAIDYLLGTIGLIITKIRLIAAGIGEQGLREAQAFSEGSFNVISTLAGGLKLFEELSQFKDIPAAKLEELWKGLEGALDLATKLFQRAEAIKAEAAAFANSMKEAARLFAEGQSIGNGIGGTTAPLGVGGGNGGGGGNPGGVGDKPIFNFTLHGDIYDGARFEDRVVGAIATANLRGRG